MESLRIYVARAMDARSPQAILADDERYKTCLEKIGATFVNLYNPLPEARDVREVASEIVNNDLKKLLSSDIVLADLSLPTYQYVGCIFEICFAFTNKIPVVLIAGENDISKRVFFQEFCDFICNTLEQAANYISRAFQSQGISQQLEEMKSYYSLIAPQYAHRARSKHHLLPEEESRFTNERAELRSVLSRYVSGDACQVGIGTGDWTSTVCEKALRVTAIEQSKEMLAEAYRYLASYNNVSFLNQDVLTDGLGTGPYDCVVVYFLLSLLPKSMQYLLFSRIRQVLQPNGLLIVADTRKIDDAFAVGLGRRQLQERKAENAVFTLYKEHFSGDALQKLITQQKYRVLDFSHNTEWFSWVVAQKVADL
jgi:ubiquinone/menaquinone biosynthesis C-methylase UbiE/nucleoside 2-deoxyribosyltransferase